MSLRNYENIWLNPGFPPPKCGLTLSSLSSNMLYLCRPIFPGVYETKMELLRSLPHQNTFKNVPTTATYGASIVYDCLLSCGLLHYPCELILSSFYKVKIIKIMPLAFEVLLQMVYSTVTIYSSKWSKELFFLAYLTTKASQSFVEKSWKIEIVIRLCCIVM